MNNIGFIGLGNMGSKMSHNLVKNGYNVTGFDINVTKELEIKLNEDKIFLASNLEEAINDKNFVITMLPDGHALKQVILSNYKYADKKTVFIDSSTIDVKTTKEIYDVLENNDLDFLDAPVSGGVIGAKNATLTFMVGGKNNIYETCIPLFEAMGNKSVLCGENGSGQSIKLCNNMILAITMIGVGEALNIAQELNLDLQKFFEVVSTSSGSCWAVNNYFPIKNIGPNSPADSNFEGGFSTNLMVKDLSLAIQTAKDLNTEPFIGLNTLNIYKKMVEEGNGKLDFSSIVKNL